MNKDQFKGKKFLVTGASSGIGAATVAALSEGGAEVIQLGRDKNRLIENTEGAKSGTFFSYEVDLEEVEKIETLSRRIAEENGPLDGLIHCAGVSSVRPLGVSKYSFMLQVMNVNYFSFVELVRCFTKRGRFNAGMSIVGVSAIGAFLGKPTKTAYCASKAAMNSAVRCIAQEVYKKGVRINTVAPGATLTPMMENLTKVPGGEATLDAIAERQFLGVCEPEDIVQMILFLLSNSAKKISGSCLPVDGGALIK
ncbi:MAG: SDR family NAD(P)-dependent oxidoreductase [Lewinella sp.]|uniref:SDR family NAD(P)-dependent oxidoreductase n=1 Tax=Lewinella sp. TaxID=2004506 RepID=UPI003D6A863F